MNYVCEVDLCVFVPKYARLNVHVNPCVYTYPNVLLDKRLLILVTVNYLAWQLYMDVSAKHACLVYCTRSADAVIGVGCYSFGCCDRHVTVISHALSCKHLISVALCAHPFPLVASYRSVVTTVDRF
jgi:hypothetical protein